MDDSGICCSSDGKESKVASVYISDDHPFVEKYQNDINRERKIILEPNALRSSSNRNPKFDNCLPSFERVTPQGKLAVPPSSFTNPSRVHLSHVAHADNSNCSSGHCNCCLLLAASRSDMINAAFFYAFIVLVRRITLRGPDAPKSWWEHRLGKIAAKLLAAHNDFRVRISIPVHS